MLIVVQPMYLLEKTCQNYMFCFLLLSDVFVTLLKVLRSDKQMKKPMIIQDVSDFVQIFSKIVKNFMITSKSTSLCNDVLDIFYLKRHLWHFGSQVQHICFILV